MCVSVLSPLSVLFMATYFRQFMAENIHMKQLQTPTPLTDVLAFWHIFVFFFWQFPEPPVVYDHIHGMGTQHVLGTGLNNIQLWLFIYKSIKIESFLNTAQLALSYSYCTIGTDNGDGEQII